jgi:hypothetical protein
MLRLPDPNAKIAIHLLGLAITRLRIRTVSGVQTAGISRPMYPDRFPEFDVEYTSCISGEDGWCLDVVGVRTVVGKAQPFAARHGPRLSVVGASRRRLVWAVDAR